MIGGYRPEVVTEAAKKCSELNGGSLLPENFQPDRPAGSNSA